MDIALSATLTEWEDGCDLLISAIAPASREDVWNYLVDPTTADNWFAPWTRDGDVLTFDFDGEQLVGDIIGCETNHFLLLELPFGRVGVSLKDVDDAEAVAATRVSVTHTCANFEEAQEVVPEIGPVWDTHLRALLAELGATDTDIDEQTQAHMYERLTAEIEQCDDEEDEQ